ncbi:hypothetical protein BGW36DRAFT_399066 [Talaromyces proteolyticus]|uniref:Zn(2)-C6 fungal-type domain-containing protein n=1 Tax=Talaromyces proteolyticus TaxID=1131652 RepID=A0AAD4KJC0_9EURO|nr:uncharacterized protein BGW36DRAFT_399066 [Talaromyces proteolyticus]KAH8693810.1 hypothetical protein BGW36DRAFT_399066 [Talaromyces proteolyticus]
MYNSIGQLTHQLHGKKKVKTGCKTCKTRRVKCDESRPACRRCISTGRVCSGYGIWGGGGSPYNQPQSNRALSVYCTPVPAGNLSREEQIHFDWFLDKTTRKFAGLFVSDFWETLVFQASAQEPAVRHAIVALSAAHRIEQGEGLWAIPTTYGFDVEQFTLQQYNKAITHLRIVTGSTGKDNLRVALITCMIFVTLEYLRGQYQKGSTHLYYGIQLLSNISVLQPRSSISPNILSHAEDFAHNALIDSYSRLSIQAAMFGHVPWHMFVMSRDPRENALPYTFSSLLGARQTLDDLLNRIHCLERHCYRLRASQLPTKNLETLDIQRKILDDLSLWRKIYDASLARIEADADRKEKFGLRLLTIYYELAVVMASVCLSEDEIIFDSHTENFIAILTGFVNLWNYWASLTTEIKEVKDMLCDPESEKSCHGFTVESGFILPMYYTALKCRIPRIRRLAIRILRSAPHREGVWNGPLLAKVLEEVIRIEENGLCTVDTGDEEDADLQSPKTKDFFRPNINLSSRIWDVSVILPDRDDDDTFMSYKKRIDNGQWITIKQKIASRHFWQPN